MILTFLLYLYVLLSILSCSPTVKYIKVPYTTPPALYYPTKLPTNATMRDMLFEYRNALMKISEWEDREFINNSNYYSGNTNKNKLNQGGQL